MSLNFNLGNSVEVNRGMQEEHAGEHGDVMLNHSNMSIGSDYTPGSRLASAVNNISMLSASESIYPEPSFIRAGRLRFDNSDDENSALPSLVLENDENEAPNENSMRPTPIKGGNNSGADLEFGNRPALVDVSNITGIAQAGPPVTKKRNVRKNLVRSQTAQPPTSIFDSPLQGMLDEAVGFDILEPSASEETSPANNHLASLMTGQLESCSFSSCTFDSPPLFPDSPAQSLAKRPITEIFTESILPNTSSELHKHNTQNNTSSNLNSSASDNFGAESSSNLLNGSLLSPTVQEATRKRRSPAIVNMSDDFGSARRSKMVCRRPSVIVPGTILPIDPTVGKKETYITGEVLVDVFQGNFPDCFKSVTVVDCRYPFEFEGGHITGAVNLWTEKQAYEHFFKSKPKPQRNELPELLVFHCEFSQKRGPGMWSFLREQDRNSNVFPNLSYPEIYVLYGGYKMFFEDARFLKYCTPQTYRPMVEEGFSRELQRAKKMEKDNKMQDKLKSLRRMKTAPVSGSGYGAL